MKYLSTLLIALFSIPFAIAQNSNQQSLKAKFVEQKEAGTFSNYTVKVSEGNSRCQILINDVPLMYYEGSGERSFYANSAILNSGQQSIEIVTSGKTPLVTIVETKTGSGAYAQKEIWNNKGKLKGNFTATVPYANIGWSSSGVISAETTKEAKIWFEKMEGALKSGNGAEFMKQLVPAEKTAALIYKLSDEETATFHRNWTNFISKKEYSVVPVADCKIETAGNGKLVHLKNNLGEGGFALKANNGQLFLLDVFLHVPKGKSKLEPVLANFKQVTTNFKKRTGD